jgi:hypothetical protein
MAPFLRQSQHARKKSPQYGPAETMQDEIDGNEGAHGGRDRCEPRQFDDGAVMAASVSVITPFKYRSYHAELFIALAVGN